jgi:8-hydroxy-5-deazaflavin:NADPH oxidoreductase
LKAVVLGLGAGSTAGSVREAAQADLVVLAVQWPSVAKALAGLPDWNDRILIDATNPTAGPPDFKLAELGGKTSSQVVASLAPGARVVKALNTLTVANLSAAPREAGGRGVLFMSGDDASAKQEVVRVLDRIGTVDAAYMANAAPARPAQNELTMNLQNRFLTRHYRSANADDSAVVARVLPSPQRQLSRS